MRERRPRVLLADDSLVVRTVIRGQLGDAYEVIEAGDGNEALNLVRSTEPDVVLLDVEMPGRTGYEVLVAVQADPTVSHIPVVFLSGRVTAEDVATGLKLGAHDYLRKPVEPGELIARLTAALRSKQLHDRLRRDNAQLREIAGVDSLTGTLDLRGLHEQLLDLSRRSGESGRPLGAVLLDITGLAAINDAHGWACGDAVLQEVATRMAACVSEGQVLGRCGPDELLALAPDCDQESVTALAQRIQFRMVSEPVLLSGQPLPVSVKIAAAAVRGGDPADLLTRLQSAMAGGADADVAGSGEDEDPRPGRSSTPRPTSTSAAPQAPARPAPPPPAAPRITPPAEVDPALLLDAIRNRSAR